MSIGTFFSSTVWSYFTGGGWRTGEREREREQRNVGLKDRERKNGRAIRRRVRDEKSGCDMKEEG